MKIIIGSDHGGFELKEKLITHIKKLSYECVDVGCYNQESVDYPDIAKSICEKVLEDNTNIGIAVCGTGIGISIACNKINGIRCALLSDEFSAQATKQHNNSNVIAFGGRVLSDDKAIKLFDLFIKSEFEGGRHLNRINKIKELEGLKK